jgi:hypothetical protein
MKLLISDTLDRERPVYNPLLENKTGQATGIKCSIFLRRVLNYEYL